MGGGGQTSSERRWRAVVMYRVSMFAPPEQEKQLCHPHELITAHKVLRHVTTRVIFWCFFFAFFFWVCESIQDGQDV